MNKEKKQMLSEMEVAGFCSQVQMMLSSGLALYEGIEALARSCRGTENEMIFSRLSEKVMETGLLSKAFESDPVWPGDLARMTRVGEITGRLEEIMKTLSLHYEREARVKSAVRHAVTYPIVLGVMVFVIVAVMLLMVLPAFKDVLSTMGVSLAGSGLIEAGVVLGWLVLALVLLFILGLVLGAAFMKSRARAKVLSLLERVFPPVKRVNQNMNAARIAMVLSMTLSGGFQMDEGMQLTESVLTGENAKKTLKEMSKNIENGLSFPDAVQKTNLFDPIYVSMIRTGVEVGLADSVMAKIAEEYQEKAERSISSIVSVIEPTLVALLAIVVGAMLLSVMLPMAGVLAGVF